MTDTSVEADGHGGLWITMPSGRRYHRPAEPLLDHPGLVTGSGAGHVDATASDPDPPTPGNPDDDIPPF